MVVISAKRTILFFHEGDRAGRTKTHKPARSHLIPCQQAPQEIPDWVGEQSAFQDACKDDTIRVIQFAAPAAKPAPAPKAEKEKAADAKQPEPAPAKVPDLPVDLRVMNKAELVDHALLVHGIELDEKSKKDDLITAIEEHKEAKKAATASS